MDALFVVNFAFFADFFLLLSPVHQVGQTFLQDIRAEHP
jgi:hypothetical protein